MISTNSATAGAIERSGIWPTMRHSWLSTEAKMKLSVGEVVHSPGNKHGHSFAVANESRAPLLTLTYGTAGEAEMARSVITGLLEHATEIIAHPVRS
jgi:hypothetical protein